MCTWIELRCDKRGENQKCMSNQNTGPMELSGDARAEINATLKMIADEARKSGWKKTKDGWVCPRCLPPPNTRS